MRKRVGLVLTVVLMTFALSVVAAEGVAEAPKEVTHVIKNENSLTGYEVKFVFPDNGYKRVRIEGEWVFSDDIHATQATSLGATPFEWKDGMFPTNNMKKTYDMKLNAETKAWELTLPLPNGTFSYTFFLDGKEDSAIMDYTGATKAWDPGNVPYGAATVSDYNAMGKYSTRYFQSAIYVPRDEAKQIKTADHTMEAPRMDGNAGTVEFSKIFVNDAIGEQPYGLYLPKNFDVNRAKQYPVIILCHGGGNDESNWFTCGAAAHILDNSIAQQRVEPTVVVTINGTLPNWNFAQMMVTVDKLLEKVIKEYNVSPEPSRHAFTGLSMGGMTTTYALYSRVDSFDYFGIMSGSFGKLVERVPELANYDYGADILKQKNIMISAGTADPALYNDIIPAQKAFGAAKTPFISKVLPGGHDWDFWTQVLAWELENFMWK